MSANRPKRGLNIDETSADTLSRSAGHAGGRLSSLSAPASGHHSFEAEYDGTKTTTLTGIVTKVDWVNPHAYIFINTKDDAGAVKEIRFELGPPYALVRGGWKRDTVKIGDKITWKARHSPRIRATAGRERCRQPSCSPPAAAEVAHEVTVKPFCSHSDSLAGRPCMGATAHAIPLLTGPTAT